MVFIKEFFQRVDFGEESTDTKNPNITLHAKSVLLKCVFFNTAIRCETAIKTNDSLYKHLQLGVGPNLLNVLNKLITIVLLCTDMPLLLKNKLADHGHSFQCSPCINCN